jgi:hypothetical protein
MNSALWVSVSLFKFDPVELVWPLRVQTKSRWVQITAKSQIDRPFGLLPSLDSIILETTVGRYVEVVTT